MNRKPHSLDITCSYQVVGRKTKKKLGKSKFEGWIHLKDNKTEIVLPMRSFVKNFIDKLHDIFAGENNLDISKITSVSMDESSSVASRAGIVIGTGINPVALTQTALTTRYYHAAQAIYKGTTFTAPHTPNESQIYSGVRRLFTNASSAQWSIYEVGLMSRKVASTASNIPGLVMLTRDNADELFEAASDKLVELQFVMGRDSINPGNGGVLVNFMRLFYNLYLKGATNDVSILPRYSTLTASHPTASATSHFVVDGAATKLWGIVVGDLEAVPVGGDLVSLDENNIDSIHTTLTYGANTVSAVVQSGGKAYFTVSRDITNGTTSTIRVRRIGLLTKGATADPSALQNDQVFLMINKPSNPYPINLVPNQTIRVEYTFEIQAG